MIKKIFAFVTLILTLNFAVAFAAQTYDDLADDINNALTAKTSTSIVDTLHLLKSNEVTALTQKIQRVEQKHQIKIGIEFLKNTHGQNITDTANSLLDKNFAGAQNGGILLLVVMDTRNWRISTDSAMRAKISDKDTEAIAKSFVGYLSDGYYYDACDTFIDDVDEYLTAYENGTPYADSTEFDSSVFICAVIASIVLGGVFRSMLISSMSNVKPAVSAEEYLKRDSVKITERRDTYLFTNVSRRRKGNRSTQNSGRSGGGGGHGGSGGSF